MFFYAVSSLFFFPFMLMQFWHCAAVCMCFIIKHKSINVGMDPDKGMDFFHLLFDIFANFSRTNE